LHNFGCFLILVRVIGRKIRKALHIFTYWFKTSATSSQKGMFWLVAVGVQKRNEQSPIPFSTFAQKFSND